MKKVKVKVEFEVPEYRDGKEYLQDLMGPIEVAHDAAKMGLALTDEDTKRLGYSFARLMVSMGLV